MALGQNVVGELIRPNPDEESHGEVVAGSAAQIPKPTSFICKSSSSQESCGTKDWDMMSGGLELPTKRTGMNLWNNTCIKFRATVMSLGVALHGYRLRNSHLWIDPPLGIRMWKCSSGNSGSLNQELSANYKDTEIIYSYSKRTKS